MGRIGLSDVFFLAKNYEWEGSFVMTQKTLIDKEDIPCEEDPNYSFKVWCQLDITSLCETAFQDCILSWVAATAGCHLDWFSAPPGNMTNICTQRDDISKYEA